MRTGTCMVVMYHYIRETAATPFSEIRALSPAQFEQQLDWLQAHYRVITQAELEAAVNGASTLPADAALLTFDDGFLDHFETAFPVLCRRGLSGVFFVTADASRTPPRLLGVHKTHFLLAKLGATAFARDVLAECQLTPSAAAARQVFGIDRWEAPDERAIKHLLNYELPFVEAERVLDTLFVRHVGPANEFARGLYLDEHMVREMAAGGMTLGYHTRSHRMLSRLDPVEQERELRDGVAWIRELTGQRTVPFCYPWGGPQTYTGDTLRLLRDAGYSVAFNTVRRRADVRADPRYELPRFDTRDLPPYTRGEEDAVAAAGPVDEA